MYAVGKNPREILDDGNFVKVTIKHCLAGEIEDVIISFSKKFGSINNSRQGT